MFSQTVEYALRAIVTIAQHDGAPSTSQQISTITQVPLPYLSKLMQGLVRAKLVTSKRGLGGGFVLTKSPSELSILEVVDAVEPFQRIHGCPLGIASHGGTLCPLHRRLDNAMALVEESLRTATIAEMVDSRGGVTPLCEKKKLMQIAINIGNNSSATSTANKTKKKSASGGTSKSNKKPNR